MKKQDKASNNIKFVLTLLERKDVRATNIAPEDLDERQKSETTLNRKRT